MKKFSARRIPKPATPSPEQRARICELIHEQMEREAFTKAYRKRQIWARLVIGLRVRPSRFDWERCR